MKITKEDFEVIFEIGFLNVNSIKSLTGRIAKNEETTKDKLNALIKKGILESDKHGIYSFTNKGKKIWNDKKYDKWKEELEEK